MKKLYTLYYIIEILKIFKSLKILFCLKILLANMNISLQIK